MGKRIPGKKHRGVKDPMLQKFAREELLKNKFDTAPKNIDCQEMPKSVERIMKLKQLTKEGKFDRPKKKRRKHNLLDMAKFISKEKILPGMSKPDHNLPALVQQPHEGNQEFLSRVNHATDTFIKEIELEAKYNMKMKRDEKTGQVKFDKVELHPVDKMFQDKLQASQKRKPKKKGGSGTSEQVLSKTAKRRLRLQAKKERLKELEGEGGNENEFARFTDKVEFNEVVHRPPQITALPRKAPLLDEARRPGSKPGLLLSKLFTPQLQDGPRRDLTVRRKDLSMSDRRRLDKAQTEAIQAYRQIRAHRSAAVT